MGAIHIPMHGRNHSPGGSDPIPMRATKSLIVTASSSGSTTLLAHDSAHVIKVVSFGLMANAVVNVKFISGSTDISGLFYLPA